MVEQQSRATRLVRAFGLFTLLAGVAVMHAVVFGAGHATADTTHSSVMAQAGISPALHSAISQPAPRSDTDRHGTAAMSASNASGNHTTESMPSAAVTTTASETAALTSTAMATLGGPAMSMDMPGCGGDCGNGHAGLHGCLFVLTALLLGLGLALLAWVGLSRSGTAVTKVRQLRPHRARPPPWTVLSLADLAILRI